MNSEPNIGRQQCGIFLSVFAALMFFAAPALAAPAAAPASPDDPLGNATTPTELCEQIQAAKAQIHSTPKLRLIWDLLRVKLAPGSVVKPLYDSLPTAPAQQLALQGGGVPEGRNLIFSLEPFEELQGGPAAEAAKTRYSELESELRQMQGTFMSFVRARDVAECVAHMKTSGFDFGRLTKISTEMEPLEWVGQIKDGQAANRIVSRKLRSLRLHWEFFKASDLISVFNALRSTNVRNVVIVAHSLSDGNLVDSSFNEYPNRFFASDLSPTLESISIYSCHGDKVSERYGLSQALKSFPTYHARRWVFTARGVKLLGQSDVVPMEGLDHFLGKVDRWLSYSPRGTGQTAPEAAPHCTIELSGLQATQGGYAFLLNGDFVGSIDAVASAASQAGPLRLDFPCSLEKAKNVLIMRNSAGVGTSSVASTDSIHGTIVRGGQSTALPDGTIYRHEDGAFQSAKWDWTKE